MNETKPRPKKNYLTPMEKRFVQNVHSGMDLKEAARAAGYKFPNAVGTIVKRPVVAKAIRDRYDRKVGMAELKDAMEFAKVQGNASALVEAAIARAKISGLFRGGHGGEKTN